MKRSFGFARRFTYGKKFYCIFLEVISAYIPDAKEILKKMPAPYWSSIQELPVPYTGFKAENSIFPIYSCAI